MGRHASQAAAVVRAFNDPVCVDAGEGLAAGDGDGVAVALALVGEGAGYGVLVMSFVV